MTVLTTLYYIQSNSNVIARYQTAIDIDSLMSNNKSSVVTHQTVDINAQWQSDVILSLSTVLPSPFALDNY